jgi:DNA polymerase-3 subunit gamma/tau
MKTARASASKYLDLTDSESERLAADAAAFTRELLSYHCRLLDDAYSAMQRPGASRRTVAELALVRMCEPKLSASPESLVARIEDLEKQLARLIASGGIVAPAAASAPSKQASSLESAPKESEEPPSEEPKTDAERKSKASGGDRALDSWGLVLEEFAELKPSLRPFLKGSTATVSEDGTLTVTLTVKLFLGMLSGDEASKTMLLNIVRSKGEAVSAIRFVSGAKQENKNQIEF